MIFVSSIVCFLLGAGATWLFMQPKLNRCQQDLVVAQSERQDDPPKLDEFMRQMLHMASQMDGNVERHTGRLTEINDGLKQAAGESPSAVIDMTSRLIEANAQLKSELNQARDQIATKQRDLETYISQSRVDTLTGLNNRRAFDSELARHFAQRQRQGTSLSLLMIDIDHFKGFNDKYGHLAGDLVLRSVAQVLSDTLRGMDLVCRYGGEEFAVICPGSNLQQAATAARRVCEAVAQNFVMLKDGPIRVTASIGVAEVDTGEVENDLIQRADNALYAAKAGGRNCVFLHQEQTCVPLIPAMDGPAAELEACVPTGLSV